MHPSHLSAPLLQPQKKREKRAKKEDTKLATCSPRCGLFCLSTLQLACPRPLKGASRHTHTHSRTHSLSELSISAHTCEGGPGKKDAKPFVCWNWAEEKFAGSENWVLHVRTLRAGA